MKDLTDKNTLFDNRKKEVSCENINKVLEKKPEEKGNKSHRVCLHYHFRLLKILKRRKHRKRMMGGVYFKYI